MKRRIPSFMLVATLILVMLASTPPARAESYVFRLFDLAGTCDVNGLYATGWADIRIPREVQMVQSLSSEAIGIEETLPAVQVPATDVTGPVWVGIPFIPPLASNTYSLTYHFDMMIDGVLVGTASVIFKCDDGVFSFMASSWDGSFSGPAVPADFVLRTITCDVAVFDTPAGAPVGSNRITAGQTFFASAQSTTGPDGEPWSQVFVSSVPIPWIPTRCIGH